MNIHHRDLIYSMKEFMRLESRVENASWNVKNHSKSPVVTHVIRPTTVLKALA
ncbi:MAG: hypothetical protein QXZ05_06340 [Sulfolobales archaeon]